VQQVRYSNLHHVAAIDDLTDEEVRSMVQYVSKKNSKSIWVCSNG
jgi:hypothetical protein